jgi:hypothetical protein
MGVCGFDWLAGSVASLEPDDLDVGVAPEEPDQLGADIARRPDDPDPDPLTGGRPTVGPGRRRGVDTRAHGRAAVLAHSGSSRRTMSITA